MVTMVTRKAKNGIFSRKSLRAKDLILGVHIQLNFGSYMGWISPGHTSYFSCVWLKGGKKGISAKTLEPKELDHEPIYIWNQYHLGNVLSTCI